MKRIMAVCDTDAEYAKHFCAYANSRTYIPWTVMAFSETEEVKRYVAEHETDVILAAEKFYPLLSDAPAGVRVWLSEASDKTAGEETVMCRYHSAEQILKRIMKCYENSPGQKPFLTPSGTCCIAGIASPAGRCGKTALALAVGEILARESRVLFLSFETSSAFGNRTEQEDLSDVLYHCENGSISLLQIGQAVQIRGKLEYISPVCCPDDLSGPYAEKLAFMTKQITQVGGYDYVILDFGDVLSAGTGLFEICRLIYVPSPNEKISEKRVDSFLKYLELSAGKNVMEKVRKISFPKPDRIEETGYGENLFEGEFGEYAGNIADQIRQAGKR